MYGSHMVSNFDSAIQSHSEVLCGVPLSCRGFGTDGWWACPAWACTKRWPICYCWCQYSILIAKSWMPSAESCSHLCHIHNVAASLTYTLDIRSIEPTLPCSVERAEWNRTANCISSRYDLIYNIYQFINVSITEFNNSLHVYSFDW